MAVAGVVVSIFIFLFFAGWSAGLLIAVRVGVYSRWEKSLPFAELPTLLTLSAHCIGERAETGGGWGVVCWRACQVFDIDISFVTSSGNVTVDVANPQLSKYSIAINCMYALMCE